MKLKLSLLALHDLNKISDYVYERNPRAAQEFRKVLHASMQIIEMHPDIGRIQRLGIRRYAVPRIPYLIFYRRDEKAQVINILTIRHAARRPSDFSY